MIKGGEEMKKTLALAVCAMTVISMSVNSFALETMKRGTRGDDVREIQEKLISMGYLEEGGADGISEPKQKALFWHFSRITRWTPPVWWGRRPVKP